MDQLLVGLSVGISTGTADTMVILGSAFQRWILGESFVCLASGYHNTCHVSRWQNGKCRNGNEDLYYGEGQFFRQHPR